MHESYLNSRVLVLNKNWLPVGVSPIKKILKKMFCGHCEIVDMYRPDESHDYSYATMDLAQWMEHQVRTDEPYIVTKRYLLAAPLVVKFDSYKHMPKMKVKLNKAHISARDGGCCQYCGKQVSRKMSDDKIKKLRAFTIDHVTPKAKGGKHMWTNVVTACLECNHKKGDRTLDELGWKLLNGHPKEPDYDEAFIRMDDKRHACWNVFLDKVVAKV